MSKIVVYSGNDIVSSRKAFLDYLQSLQAENFELVRASGKDLTEEALELHSFPISLFGQKKVLAIENILSNTKSKEKEKIIEKIAKQKDCGIVIWEGKDISKTDQKKYPVNFVFKNFKLPQILFKFLDSLSPGKTKENLDFFHKVIEEVDPAFVFLMIIRQFRYLILASENELTGMPPWQKGKLFHQSKLFNKERLSVIYERLLEIDYRQKTSQIIKDLAFELDLLLTEL